MKRRALFPAALAVAALVAATVTLPQLLPRREAVHERLPPNFAALLPSGAMQAASSRLELPDSPQPSYVAGYKNGDDVSVSLIVWNRDENRYVVASTVTLVAGESRLENLPTLALQPLGGNAPTLIVARGETGEGAFVLIREGNALRIVSSFKDPLVFEDVNGDGAKEVIALDGATMRVYVWKNGALTYDPKLSLALGVDKKVFPEPAVAP